VTGQTRGKAGNSLYGAYGQDFLCADGTRVMVIGLTARQWKNLLKVTGLSEPMAALEAELGVDFSDEGARWMARQAITAVLAPWFAARHVAEFGEAFDRAGVTWSVFRTFAEAIEEDPDLSAENPIFAEVTQPGIGTYLSPGSPFTFDAAAREAAAPAPLLGQHTEAVLADVAKLPDGEIARLFDEGVVAQPPRAALRLAS
jgi:2-methylfumaryl-CoA isomerase